MHRPNPEGRPFPRVAAHRGASARALENSLRAMDLARALGAQGAEFDVHATADGAFVVHHDAVIPGLGPVAELPAERVFAHSLSDGSRIPSLAAVLAALPGLEAWVEVKGLAPTWDDAFLHVLGQAAAPGRIAVHAFDHRIVDRLRRRQPSLGIGVLQSSYPVDPLEAALRAGATTLWQHWELIDAPLVRAAHSAGLEVVAWTVPDHAVQRLAVLGVDVLCVNAPDAALMLLQSPRSFEES